MKNIAQNHREGKVILPRDYNSEKMSKIPLCSSLCLPLHG